MDKPKFRGQGACPPSRRVLLSCSLFWTVAATDSLQLCTIGIRKQSCVYKRCTQPKAASAASNNSYCLEDRRPLFEASNTLKSSKCKTESSLECTEDTDDPMFWIAVEGCARAPLQVCLSPNETIRRTLWSHAATIRSLGAWPFPAKAQQRSRHKCTSRHRSRRPVWMISPPH